MYNEYITRAITLGRYNNIKSGCSGFGSPYLIFTIKLDYKAVFKQMGTVGGVSKYQKCRVL